MAVRPLACADAVKKRSSPTSRAFRCSPPISARRSPRARRASSRSRGSSASRVGSRKPRRWCATSGAKATSTRARNPSSSRSSARLLTPADHKFRADLAFYKEESGRLMRSAKLAGDDEIALAKAQFAVLDEAHNAEALLAAVPEKVKSDPSYIFARIEMLRRANKPDKLAEAAKLMLSAPRDPAVLIDGDAWWIERRLDRAQASRCGRRADRLSDLRRAQRAKRRDAHRSRISRRLDRASLPSATRRSRPLTSRPPQRSPPCPHRSRAPPTGRAERRRCSATKRRRPPPTSQAAEHVTTYYGQLARSKLGLSDLPLRQTRKLATGDGRDLSIRVAEFFYALGESDFALPIVADAARHFTDEGPDRGARQGGRDRA